MLREQPTEWSGSEAEPLRDSTIADLFRRQAELTPDAAAVIHKDRRLSYRELDEASNGLARHLQNLGVKAESLVGICMGRNENLVVGLLAILKAGGAYVPLDPKHPKERLRLVTEDSAMTVLLASAETRAMLPFDLRGVEIVDVACKPMMHGRAAAAEIPAAGSDLAYAMYTSGSTGRPKGVMVEHRNVVNFFTGMDQAIGSTPGVWLAVTSVAFDISVLELLWTLTRGFTVVVLEEGSAGSIGEEIRRHHVTHLQMTPSLARMLTLDASAFGTLGGLKKMLLGGEEVPASLIRRIRKVFKGDLFNMYGPTETTIWSTTYKIIEPGVTVPIGRPIANTQVYVLNEGLEPVSPGETGELYIGGAGVARGYLHRPELTAERFVEIPALSPGRLYRTGDLVRMGAGGDLEFLGRLDYQVKLRGHRIELGEIEAALGLCEGVSQAVVMAREDREGDARLVAYLVADQSEAAQSAALRSALAMKLPEIMIPSEFVFLSNMPLTGNGKIDRKALLSLTPRHGILTSASNEMLGVAGNEMERMVTKVWQEALGLSAIELNDNFFDLGAHSLTVAEVQSKLQSSLGRAVSLVDLFQFTTVSSLASHLTATQPIGEQAQPSDRARRRRLARQS